MGWTARMEHGRGFYKDDINMLFSLLASVGGYEEFTSLFGDCFRFTCFGAIIDRQAVQYVVC
jgi:hypothetical protein